MSIDSAVPRGLDWRISRTCDGGACVGVARRGKDVFIGNTSNFDSPVSKFTVDEWQAFVVGVKEGDFDSL